MYSFTNPLLVFAFIPSAIASYAALCANSAFLSSCSSPATERSCFSASPRSGPTSCASMCATSMSVGANSASTAPSLYSPEPEFIAFRGLPIRIGSGNDMCVKRRAFAIRKRQRTPVMQGTNGTSVGVFGRPRTRAMADRTGDFTERSDHPARDGRRTLCRSKESRQ